MAARIRNGRSENLESAIALLIQTQAQFLQTQARFIAHLDEDRERFSRIERDLDFSMRAFQSIGLQM
jgi:hypothetical protein